MKSVLFLVDFDISRAYKTIGHVVDFFSSAGYRVSVLHTSPVDIVRPDPRYRRIPVRQGRPVLNSLTVAAYFIRALYRYHDVVICFGVRSTALIILRRFKVLRPGIWISYNLELVGDRNIDRVINRLLRHFDIVVDANEDRAAFRSAHLGLSNTFVIHNYPPTAVRNFAKSLARHHRERGKGIVWYHGSIMKYQGIPVLVEGFALSKCACELHITGPVFDKKVLHLTRQTALPTGKALHIHPAQDQLGVLAEASTYADVAVCFYPPPLDQGTWECHNLYFAEPAKFYEYLLLRIPILVTAHPNLTRMVHEFEAGEVLEEFTGSAVAEALDNVINKCRSHRYYTAIDDDSFRNLALERDLHALIVKIESFY